MQPAEPSLPSSLHQRFADLEHIPIGLAVLNPSLRILFWNGVLGSMTGIESARAVGQSLAELNPVWGKPHYAGRLSHLFEGGPPVVFSPLLHPKIVPVVGTEKRSFQVKATAVPDGDGGWWAILSVEEVTALTRRVAELRAAQDMQTRLMKEIHHRVKNNLNMISGLISMQRAQVGNEAAQSALGDLQSRIVAISEIHDVLYHSSNFGAGSTADYLENLGRLMNDSLSEPEGHRLEFQLDRSIALGTDTTVLLGLIQAELMTNALKYGLGKGADAFVRIRLERTGTQSFRYELAHSGNRLPEGFDPRRSNGLGMVLLMSYTTQLRSQLQWAAEDPTRFWFEFVG